MKKKKNKARKGRDWNVKCTGGFPPQYVNFIHSEVSAGQQTNEKKKKQLRISCRGNTKARCHLILMTLCSISQKTVFIGVQDWDELKKKKKKVKKIYHLCQKKNQNLDFLLFGDIQRSIQFILILCDQKWYFMTKKGNKMIKKKNECL